MIFRFSQVSEKAVEQEDIYFSIYQICHPTKKAGKTTAKCGLEKHFFSLVFSGADESLHNFSSILLVSQWKQKRWFIRYPYFQSPCMQFLTHIPSWKYKMSHITFDHWWLICWELQTSLNKWEMCVSSPQKNTSVWRKKLLHTISAVSWILWCKIIDSVRQI